jgi:WD40 repeat protein/uncharacterized caspase-like protein
MVIFKPKRVWLLLTFMLLTGPIPSPAASQDTAPILTIDAGHSNVGFLAFAPDGQWFASAGSDGTVKLWEAEGGRLIRTFDNTENDSVRSISVSADSRLAALQDLKGGIKIWEARSGKLLRRIDVGDSSGVFLASDSRSVMAVVSSNLAVGGSQNFFNRWDIETGEPQRTLLSVKDAISRSAISADERRLAVVTIEGDFQRIDIIELSSGRVSAAMHNAHRLAVHSLAWSPDGRLLVSGSDDKNAKVWDATSGRLLQTLTAPKGINAVAFSRDGRLLASAGKGIQLWETASWRLRREISSIYFWAVAFAPDGASIASGDSDGNVDQWNVANSEKLHPAKGTGFGLVSVGSLLADQWLSVGPDGLTIWDASTAQPLRLIERSAGFTQKHLVIAREAGGATYIATRYRTEADGPLNRIKIWNVENGRLHRTFEWGTMKKNSGGINPVAISEDGRWLAACADGLLKVWDVTSGRLAYSLSTHSKYGEYRLLFSRDSSTLLSLGATDGKMSLWYWSLETGKLTKAIPLSDLFYDIGASTPDGQSFVTLEGLAKDKAINLLGVGGKVIRSLGNPISGWLEDAAFSPDGRFISIATSTKPNLVVYELANGNKVHTLEGNSGIPNSIAYSSDGRQLMVGNNNGTSAIWETRSGSLLVTTVHQASGEWLSITPEGFFISSEHGAELLHVVNGFRTIGVDQFYQSLYRPDLVREKLAGDPRGLVREAAANLDLNKVIASGSAPDVKVTLPGRSLGQGNVDGSSVSAEAEISERGGGIGRVEWRVNGVTSGVDNPAAPTPGQPVRITRSLAVNPGDNAIEVVAYNGANLIASVPARASVTAQIASPSIVPSQPAAPSAPSVPALVAAAKPRLFVLVAGVNDYADKRFRLSYAVSDAREVARGFQDASADVYQSAEIKRMTDGEVTKDKLDAAFAEMAAKTSASDVFILYLAGHGKTVDGRYYFVPQDFTVDGELNDRAINAAVKTKAIAQDQWQRWFASIPARKSVILFDTCDSGTLAGDQTQQLEKGAANDRLAQATGRSILTASGGSQEALEGYHGHGLFTYELLDAINQADGDRSGTVELNELAAYVYAQVSELSQKVFRQRQVPEMKITANFPLAKQTRILQDELTPVAEVKPNYQMAQTAQLQIKPSLGATVVRSLSAKTPVTVLESNNGWSLVATDGKPLGYVATKDLAPAQ